MITKARKLQMLYSIFPSVFHIFVLSVFNISALAAGAAPGTDTFVLPEFDSKEWRELLIEAGIPATRPAEPKSLRSWNINMRALEAQSLEVAKVLTPKHHPQNSPEKEKIILALQKRRTQVTFFIFSQVIAELVEKSKGTANKECVTEILNQWSDRAASGLYSSTKELINYWLTHYSGKGECWNLANSILGAGSERFVHGDYLRELISAETFFKIQDQKLTHLKAIRFLISQTAEQFPLAARHIQGFYMEDKDQLVSSTAKSDLAKLEEVIKSRHLLDWVRPDMLVGLSAGGLGGVLGLQSLNLAVRPLLSNSINFHALAGSLALHLGLGNKVLNIDSKAKAATVVIRNQQGKNAPQIDDAENDITDQLPFDPSRLRYDFLSGELLVEWALKARRSYLESGEISKDLGHFLIQVELQSATDATLKDFQNLHILLESAQDRLFSSLKDSSGFLEALAHARNSLSQLFPQENYKKFIPYLVPYLKGYGGNCVSSTAFFIAALSPFVKDFPKPWILAIELLPMHIQAVIADPFNLRSYDLDSGIGRSYSLQGLYSPMVLVEGFLRAKYFNRSSIEKMNWTSYLATPTMHIPVRNSAPAKLLANRFIEQPPTLTKSNDNPDENDYLAIPTEAHRAFHGFNINKFNSAQQTESANYNYLQQEGRSESSSYFVHELKLISPDDNPLWKSAKPSSPSQKFDYKDFVTDRATNKIYPTVIVFDKNLRNELDALPNASSRFYHLVQVWKDGLKKKLKLVSELKSELQNPHGNLEKFFVNTEYPLFSNDDMVSLNGLIRLSDEIGIKFSPLPRGALRKVSLPYDTFLSYEDFVLGIPELAELKKAEVEIIFEFYKDPLKILKILSRSEINFAATQGLIKQIYSLSFIGNGSSDMPQILVSPGLRRSFLLTWQKIYKSVPERLNMALADPRKVGITEKIEKESQKDKREMPVVVPPKNLDKSENRLQLLDLSRSRTLPACHGPEPTGRCKDQNIVYLNAEGAEVYISPRLFFALMEKSFVTPGTASSNAVDKRLATPEIILLYNKLLISVFKNHLAGIPPVELPRGPLINFIYTLIYRTMGAAKKIPISVKRFWLSGPSGNVWTVDSLNVIVEPTLAKTYSCLEESLILPPQEARPPIIRKIAVRAISCLEQI